ncbi:dolichyl-diphosphooligosaccharide--protein glycosyltransferase subunit 1 [Arctopsyche grandis]|uniref:dolichyl-diphosphooligosaccharide--protein glycosyltransferase subunit 1 n=1 Tax=Arctopsyche grandis TaxID=121162 RepID=UPI00406D7076
MSGRIYSIIVLTAAVVVVTAAALPSELVNDRLVNKHVERSIDLSSQLVKISAKVTLENTGDAPVKSFLVAVEPEAKYKLALLTAKDSNKRELRVVDTSVTSQPDPKFARIELKDPIQPAKTLFVTLDYVFTKSLTPHPSTISQKDKQLVRYHGNHYFYSPYKTESQKTTVTMGSKNVENYSKLKPVSLTDSTITYGTYENISPFTKDDLSVHYENNSPFLTVTQIDRVIEVSHWGNIAIEETIDMFHSGAALKGSFSRYDFQQDSLSGASSVKSYKTLLPASATGVYYRDTNGNISTSHMKVKKDAVELDLRPRFPLFGGWKTHYTLGYNVPSYEYLYHSGDQYLLKMRLIDHIYDDMAVDRVTTTIILPEGSTDIKVTTPYPITRHKDTLHHTYLDTTGRPTISFSKSNLVENHIQDFQLRYSFPRILMLQEPILVVIFLYILFLCVIVYVRLDFSIHKDDHHKE